MVTIIAGKASVDAILLQDFPSAQLLTFADLSPPTSLS